MFDAASRLTVAKRVADNLEALVRGLRACTQPGTVTLEMCFCPDARVASQRIICAFGLLLSRVAQAAKEPSHNEKSPTFVPDVCQSLRATFAWLRKDAGERGVDDVGKLVIDSAKCLQVLRLLLTPPSIRQVPVSLPSVFAATAQRGVKSDDRYSSHGAFVIATWNISGGQSSAQAPSSWVAIDQKAAVIKEINQWNADIFALHECESSDPYDG